MVSESALEVLPLADRTKEKGAFSFLTFGFTFIASVEILTFSNSTGNKHD
jgi:hypothetical protein